jgi:hypothetical protein
VAEAEGTLAVVEAALAAEAENTLAAEVIWAAAAVSAAVSGSGFRGGFRGLYGFGGILPYYGYGYGSSCYALTLYGYDRICNLKRGGVLTGGQSQSRFASKRSSVRLPIAKRNLEAERGPYCSHG